MLFDLFWFLTDFWSVSDSKNMPLTDKKSVNEAKSVPVTHFLSVSDQKCATDRQKVCQPKTFGPVTDSLSVSNSKMMPLTDKKSVSEKFSKYIIHKTFFSEEININNHRPKLFLSLMEDTHKDLAANRKVNFPLGYVYIHVSL